LKGDVCYPTLHALKLNLRRKGKKRLPNRTPEKLIVPSLPQMSWLFDFMSDALLAGRRFRDL
jgi:putative transposase